MLVASDYKNAEAHTCATLSRLNPGDELGAAHAALTDLGVKAPPSGQPTARS
jgi:hypothetical protein